MCEVLKWLAALGAGWLFICASIFIFWAKRAPTVPNDLDQLDDE